MSENKSSEFSHVAVSAKEIIRKTEKALRKHIRLIKNLEHITAIVATLERLKSSLREKDIAAMRRWIKRLDQLTQGFAQRALKRQRTHGKN